MSGFQNDAALPRAVEDDSDIEEEALVAEYHEQQVDYDDGDDLERVSSMTMAQQADDIQARLLQAAQPLDFSASLEVKFQSYDSYCGLFHFILNSDEGPIDIKLPSVCVKRAEESATFLKSMVKQCELTSATALLGLGCD